MWLCTLHTYLSVNLLLNVAMYAYYTLLTYSSENLFFNMWLYTHSTQLPTIYLQTYSLCQFLPVCTLCKPTLAGRQTAMWLLFPGLLARPLLAQYRPFRVPVLQYWLVLRPRAVMHGNAAPLVSARPHCSVTRLSVNPPARVLRSTSFQRSKLAPNATISF